MKKDSQIFSKYSDYLACQTRWARTSEHRYKQEVEGHKNCIKTQFDKFKRNITILDCACGDGIGLECFKSLGFKNVIGLDCAPVQVLRAGKFGFKIIKDDMHKVASIFHPSSFDAIYSSHTLEHAFSPNDVVRGFFDILRLFGLLFIVLPYPDNLDDAERRKIHCGSQELGLDAKDDGQTVIEFFSERGFLLRSKRFVYYREPEIWLTLERI